MTEYYGEDKLYECDYCNNPLNDTDDVIFIDRAFLPSGSVFCSVDCLMHFLNAYEGQLEDIKPLIDADEEYPMTIPEKLSGGDRTEACGVVRRLAIKNNTNIDQY